MAEPLRRSETPASLRSSPAEAGRGARDELGLALALGFAGLSLLISLRAPVPVADLPTYLALVAEGVFDVDVMTLAAGRRFVNGSWLAQRIYAWTYGLGGWPALVALHASALGAALALTARWAWRRGGGLGAAVAMGLALLLMTGNTGARPQTLAFALAAAVWACPSALGVLALSALWANVHGSVVLAPLLALAAGRPRAALGASLGLCCTPWGLELGSYVLANSARPAARGLDEWSRPGSAGGYAARLGVAGALSLVVLLRRGRSERPPWGGLLLLAGLSALALTAVRHVTWLGLLGGAVVGSWVGRAPPSEPWPVATWTRRLTVLGLAAGVALCSPWVAGPPGVTWFGDAAPSFLLRPPPAPLIDLNTSFELGGLARLSWRVRVPADARVWVLTDAEWEAYERGRIEPSAKPVILNVEAEPSLAAATEGWRELAREGPWALRAP